MKNRVVLSIYYIKCTKKETLYPKLYSFYLRCRQAPRVDHHQETQQSWDTRVRKVFLSNHPRTHQ